MMVYLGWTMQLSGVEGAVGARSMTLLWIVLLHQGLRSSREARVGGPDDGHCMAIEWIGREEGMWRLQCRELKDDGSGGPCGMGGGGVEQAGRVGWWGGWVWKRLMGVFGWRRACGGR